jgi:hypothetical protein
MGKSRLALWFVFRPDVVPDRYGHHGCLAVRVDNDTQPVLQRELFIGNVHSFHELRNRGRLGLSQRRRREKRDERQHGSNTRITTHIGILTGLIHAVGALGMTDKIAAVKMDRLEAMFDEQLHLVGIMWRIRTVCGRSIRLDRL